MRPQITFLSLLWCTGLLTAACGGPQSTMNVSGKDETARDETQAAVVNDEQAEPTYSSYHGPRKTIAVAKFDAHGAFLGKYGGSDIGGGLAAQLVSELAKTNRFIVVDRADLAAVLREQEMALEELTTKTAPKVGELLGAQLLIRGSVTEFDEAESGGGVSVGGFFGDLGGALSPRFRKGHVTIDLRLIDTTTGQVVQTHTVDKQISASAMAASVFTKDISLGGDAFSKTALGKTTRAAIQDAVAFIVEEMEEVAWQAMIAKVKAGRVYINAGADANLEVGDTLVCYRVMDKITDPVTREVLGIEEREIGRVRVVEVADRYAVATFQGAQSPRVGDALRLVSTSKQEGNLETTGEEEAKGEVVRAVEQVRMTAY